MLATTYLLFQMQFTGQRISLLISYQPNVILPFLLRLHR